MWKREFQAATDIELRNT